MFRYYRWSVRCVCAVVFSRVCLSCFVVCGGVGGFVSVVRVCRLEGSCVFLCRCLVVMGLLGVVWLLVCWLVVFGVVWVVFVVRFVWVVFSGVGFRV